MSASTHPCGTVLVNKAVGREYGLKVSRSLVIHYIAELEVDTCNGYVTGMQREVVGMCIAELVVDACNGYVTGM